MYGVTYIPTVFADDSTANFNMTNNFRYHIWSTNNCKPIAISFSNVGENEVKNGSPHAKFRGFYFDFDGKKIKNNYTNKFAVVYFTHNA